MLDLLRNIVTFVAPILLVLTLVVTVHELGHFLVAKWCGVYIERFSIGFGRAIFKRVDKSGVEWRIGWLPLGGYVKFLGDANEASVPDEDDLDSLRDRIKEKMGEEAVGHFFHFKPVWQRALITVAGPVANFLLAIAIFTAVFMTLETGRVRPVVGDVVKGSPAEAAGFMKGDLIKSANGRSIRNFEDFQVYVALRAGEKIDVVVDRAGRDVLLQAKLMRVVEKDPVTGVQVKRGGIGIYNDPKAFYYYKAKNPIEALSEACRATWDRLDTTLTYIGRIFKGQENGDQFSGIVGMAGVTGAVTKATIHESPSLGLFLASFGFRMIMIAATISIGLGFVNLLPIPMLDGGHMAFYAYEAVARRPLAARFQAASFKVGLALVLALMLFATWNDLVRFDAFRFIGGLIS